MKKTIMLGLVLLALSAVSAAASDLSVIRNEGYSPWKSPLTGMVYFYKRDGTHVYYVQAVCRSKNPDDVGSFKQVKVATSQGMPIVDNSTNSRLAELSFKKEAGHIPLVADACSEKPETPQPLEGTSI